MKIKKNNLTGTHKVAEQFILLLCLCVLFFASCTKKDEKIPEHILSKEKMVQVMVDVQIAEASIQNQNLNMTDSTKIIAAGYYRNLFEKNKITEQQFRESFLYYSHHLELLNKIYEDVINELSKMHSPASN